MMREPTALERAEAEEEDARILARIHHAAAHPVDPDDLEHPIPLTSSESGALSASMVAGTIMWVVAIVGGLYVLFVLEG